jgi:twitching motility protein PilT
VHENKKAIVVQQEVLSDTHSFTRALTHVLRQDPDVIVVGEMREPETIATALTAAETGHLVLSTLHSPSVTQAIERITGVFNDNTQKQVILQLANTLQGIVVQELLPAADRTGRVMAYELLAATNAIRNVIRENQLHSLENCLQTGAKEGMVTMDNCLLDLYRKTQISYDTALSRARHPEYMTKAG